MLQTDKAPLRSEFSVLHSSGSANFSSYLSLKFSNEPPNLATFLIKKLNEVLQSEAQNSQIKGILQTLKFLEKIIFEQIQII